MTAVLIVDDEHHIRLLIEQALEELADEGIDLLTARDGDEALDVVANQRPELIFLDVQMPRRSGYEVCRAVKSDPSTARTTVVLLTAKGQADDRQAGIDAGADDYLTKPFDPDDLLARARTALGLSGRPAAAR
jgi:two-component system alkaline phosphatase synthesis response regulator PhoP